MAGRIPQSFIDDLLARTDIVDVIDTFVPLKKAGKDFQARCPFHDEKTPSFTVSRDKQFYHCFGCQANGTVLTFLMEFNNLGFIEAVEELAERAGMPVPYEGGGPTPGGDLTEIFELLELVVRFYTRQLREHPQAALAVNYLKARCITGETAAAFEIGYAPPGWDNLIGSLGQSDAAKQRLARAGMIIKREGGGFYDRFRDRIMFPIRDQRGRAIGFGGRVLDDGTPKYLNSPETPLFQKGRELYGMNRARAGRLERLFVVEGYMDVIALVQSGVTNAVATLGTAATRDHLERLFRAVSKVVFCFDGDEAGRRAAWRALETSLPLLRDGRQVLFRFMPDGEDPDTYVRAHGAGAFHDDQVLVPLSDYLLETLKQQVDIATREGRATFVDRAVPYLRELPEGALRRLLVQDVARAAGTSTDNVEPLLGAGVKGAAWQRTARARPRRRPGTDANLLSTAIRLLLARPELALLVDDCAALRETPIKGVEFLAELLEFIHERPGVTRARILEHWRDTRFADRLRDIAAAIDDLESGEVELDLEREFLDVMGRVQDLKARQERQNLAEVQCVADLSDEARKRLRRVSQGGDGPQSKS